MDAFTKEDLKRFQAESLDDKFQRTLAKVSEWYVRWNNEVYVSFSGGKDSTVLADICAKWCELQKIPLYLVFVNTGLEYPEIQRHVKFFAQWLRDKYGIDVVLDILRPKMRFDEVIRECGYPLISKEVSNTIRLAKDNIRNGVYSHRVCKLGVKPEEYGGLYDSGEYDYAASLKNSKFTQHKWRQLLDLDSDMSEECCNIMKKEPLREYFKKTGRRPIIATMACESMNRETAWLKNGCNAFDSQEPSSRPMSFWMGQDILRYIKDAGLPIASVYGDIVYETDPDQMRIEDYGIKGGGTEKLKTTGCDRTGCIFCAFGCHCEKGKTRFQRLKETHPRQYEYCIGGGEYVWIGEHKHDNGTWGEFDLINENGEPMNETEIEDFMKEYQNSENIRVKKIWQPNKHGLGLGHVFDELNKVYGEGFIKY